jgi:hypothetical protein
MSNIDVNTVDCLLHRRMQTGSDPLAVCIRIPSTPGAGRHSKWRFSNPLAAAPSMPVHGFNLEFWAGAF